ncbi:MAG: ATP-binding cassette domain-containing protein [Actinomycetota bacterium]
MRASPPQQQAAGIRISRVTHAYGSRAVLEDVDLTITQHKTAVIGGNGSGKSTFARLINGLVVPTRGRVSVDGMDTASQGKRVRRRVGFVFQDPDAQIVFPTVAEDVAFGLKARREPPNAIAERVAAVLDDYGLSGYADHPAHLLSGGQKQMLALAAVLVLDPSYVVLDEPMTLLDLKNKRQVTEMVLALQQPVVLATHELDMLGEFERVVVLDSGRIVADGSPAESVRTYRRLMD